MNIWKKHQFITLLGIIGVVYFFLQYIVPLVSPVLVAMLFVTIFEIVFLKKKIQVLLPARTLGILSGMLFIVVTFYTFWGISGRLVDFINISIYFFAVYFALIMENCYIPRRKLPDTSVCITILIAFVILFIIFTLDSPGVGIFYDLSLHPKG